MTALARDVGASPEAELFAAVTVDEIHEPAAADRDALVYLVGSDTAEAGYAVVVTAGGHIDLLALPSLRLDDSPLGWYLHTYRGVQVLTGGDINAWRWSLSQLSSWAWQAGMGPLVDHCRTLAPDCPPRLVLIPSAPSSCPGTPPGGWSTAPSAGTRCRMRQSPTPPRLGPGATRPAARQPARPRPFRLGSRSALIIADPTGDLLSAADEADAIRRSVLPRGHLPRPTRVPRPPELARPTRSWPGSPRPTPRPPRSCTPPATASSSRTGPASPTCGWPAARYAPTTSSGSPPRTGGSAPWCWPRAPQTSPARSTTRR